MLTARSSEDGGEATELSGRGGRCFLVAAMRGAERGRDRRRGWDWDTLVCCPTNTAQCPSYNNMQSYQPCCHTVTTPINISQPLFTTLIMITRGFSGLHLVHYHHWMPETSLYSLVSPPHCLNMCEGTKDRSWYQLKYSYKIFVRIILQYSISFSRRR